MIISDKTQIAERQSTAAYYDTVLPCVFSGTKGLDVGSRLINLVLLQPPWFCRGCLFFLERDGQGGSFSFFPGVLHGSFSFSGLDFFSFAGRRVDFFPLQGWTFVLCRGGLFSFAGWIRIRCRELPEYSVPIQPSCRRLDEKNNKDVFLQFDHLSQHNPGLETAHFELSCHWNTVDQLDLGLK